MATDAPRGYVVDTNVISNRVDVDGNADLIEWLRRYAGVLRVSVVTVAEMRRGLNLMKTRLAAVKDRKVKAREQQRLVRKWSWYNEVTMLFADRVEPIDIEVAEKWAEMSVLFPSLRDADKVIAATALGKGFGVATENLGDFRRTGLPLVNPFDPATWDDEWDDDPIASLVQPRSP